MRLGEQNKIVALSHHIVAEAPGATLNESAARAVVLKGVKSEFDYNPDDLKEISAQAAKQPARTDWSFNFKLKGFNSQELASLPVRPEGPFRAARRVERKE